MAGRSQRHLREIQGRDSLGGSPVPATLPTRSGTTTNGQTQTGVNGTFTGMGTIAIRRQWYRDNDPIPGATNATYVLTAADVGKRIRFANIAESEHGWNISFSAASAVVT